VNPLNVLIATSAAFTALAVGGGEMLDLYERLPWWDVFLHLKSGWLMALVTSFLLLRYSDMRNPAAVAMLSTSVAVNLGVSWEVFEYLMDNNLGWNMQKSGLDDTMSDLVADTLGAVLGSIAAYRLCLGHNTGFFLRQLRNLIGD